MRLMLPHAIPLCLAAGLLCGVAQAKLPALTPEQQQAAAAKKQQAAEQAEKEKQDLAASMENVAGRWRKRAAENGWETHPPVPAGGTQQNATPEMPVRSEKAGTAPASADVKDPAKKGK
ncbi:MAG TPA: hypothetical protein VIM12_13150 [Noviherbaspirillum sp.]|jgi:hypothetical protein|uniref:hypothetical protein n=1 Tax=Noviherbaspirillum sp. TaxID=1926288 RepID=UPI002F94B36C